jgi:hypothetical protein
MDDRFMSKSRTPWLAVGSTVHQIIVSAFQLEGLHGRPDQISIPA